MARTQAQWYETLRRQVPTWWFEQEVYNVALFQAMAKMFAELEAEAEGHQGETFILQADVPILEAHGDERGVNRLPSETNASYAQRIIHIINQSNPVAIKSLVDTLLINGECTILEEEEQRAFYGREYFFDRRVILSDIFYNVFSILVANQLHDPYSFMSRENFAGREDFMGSTTSDIKIFEQIVAAVNKVKAFGVLYRLIETAA